MKEKNGFLKKLSGSRELGLAAILIVLCIGIQIKSPSFLTPTSISDMLKNNAVTMIMALGMFEVLLIGGMDISIASTAGLAGMSVGLLLKYGIISNTFLGILLGILIGIVCGVCVGLVISKGKVLPIIASMGFMYIFRGFAYVLSGGQWASAADLGTFKDFALTSYLGFGVINNVIMIVIVCYIIFFVVTKWTVAGRKVYAVGSNVEAASVSGINSDRVKLVVYTVMGMLSGLAGVLSVSVYGSAQPNMLYGQEMDVIAACVIGGVSMNGGRGSVVGVFLGALTMAVINKALPLVGIDSIAQNTVQGVIILAVIVLNVLTQRATDRKNLKGREM
ncbi:MAG: ABC transporter permease [Eubacteriales bacterium]|nr:ABC transporter permease [Eubacteriales bacterium]